MPVRYHVCRFCDLMDWPYTFSGFLVGFIVGVTGVGGGSLMTPLLVLVFGVAPATAVGTDLLYAALTKMGGSWAHGRRGTVDWKVVKLLACGSVPAALFCMVLLHYLAMDEKHLKALITSVLRRGTDTDRAGIAIQTLSAKAGAQS